ncbi:MAG: response regulator [Planctomycetes bacterium]|nr:response regulator [Planctomycetota bacterium]
MPQQIVVLCIDDSEVDAEILRRHVAQIPEYAIEFLHAADSDGPAADAARARADVIFLDYKLQGQTGLEVLKTIRSSGDSRPVIILTGQGDEYVAATLIRAGADDYLVKADLSPEMLHRCLEQSISEYRGTLTDNEILDEIVQHSLVFRQLEREKQTAEELFQETIRGAVTSLTAAVAIACPEAADRAHFLKPYVQGILNQLDVEKRWEVSVAARLCSLGFIAVPRPILKKRLAGEKLSKREQEIFFSHVRVGYNLVARIPRLEGVAEVLLYQEKSFDGGGYPLDAVRGADLPIGSRIIKVAGDYERRLSRGVPHHDVVEHMRKSGIYDPEVVDALLAHLDT